MCKGTNQLISVLCNSSRLKYWRMTVSVQNNIHKEIKVKLKFRDVCYDSVQQHLSSFCCLMIKMYTKLLREESGLKALESRALRIMSGPKSSGTVQHIFRQWMEKITSKFGGER